MTRRQTYAWKWPCSLIKVLVKDDGIKPVTLKCKNVITLQLLYYIYSFSFAWTKNMHFPHLNYMSSFSVTCKIIQALLGLFYVCTIWILNWKDRNYYLKQGPLIRGPCLKKVAFFNVKCDIFLFTFGTKRIGIITSRKLQVCSTDQTWFRKQHFLKDVS